MKRLLATPRRVFAVGAVAALAVVVAAGFGYAAVAADNQSYTGCLQSGSLTNIAIGATPLKGLSEELSSDQLESDRPAGRTGHPGRSGNPRRAG